MMTLFELRKSYEINQGHNVSASHIAQKAGITRQRYSRYERGQSVPDVLEASRIATVFNLKLADLVAVIRATVGQMDETAQDGLN